MKVLTVVGARPQFIKAAVVSREIRKVAEEYLVDTGQHYDSYMSKIFFDELHIPEPDVNLAVGSASHAVQTAEMMIRLEEVMKKETPDIVLLYGVTNSTLAGAIVAGKLNIPIAHVEAGVRCNVKDMPEEQNRIVTDHLARWNFVPSQEGMDYIKKEGLADNSYFVGDVMYDALLYYGELVADWTKDSFFQKTEALDNKTPDALIENGWYLTTIHRPENTDDISKFREILRGLESLDKPVIFPIHPRTRKNITEQEMTEYSNIHFVKPLGYLEMIWCCKNAKKVITDSGGLHKESYLMKVPGVVVLRNTAWCETLEGDWNVLASPDAEDIVNKVMNIQAKPECWKPYYGDGEAAKKIVKILMDSFKA